MVWSYYFIKYIIQHYNYRIQNNYTYKILYPIKLFIDKKTKKWRRSSFNRVLNFFLSFFLSDLLSHSADSIFILLMIDFDESFLSLMIYEYCYIIVKKYLCFLYNKRHTSSLCCCKCVFFVCFTDLLIQTTRTVIDDEHSCLDGNISTSLL